MFHTHIGDINWRIFTKSKHLYPKDANEQATINKNLCDYIAYLNRRIDILENELLEVKKKTSGGSSVSTSNNDEEIAKKKFETIFDD